MKDLKDQFLTKWKHPKFKLIFCIIAIITLYVLHSIYAWVHSQSTDNAYVEGDITFVSPEVSGIVEEIYFIENQKVKKGDILLKIKDKDFIANYDKAKAGLKASEILLQMSLEKIKAAELDVKKTSEQLDLAKSNLDVSGREYARISKLTRDNFSSKKIYDDTLLSFKKAETEYNQSVLGVSITAQNLELAKLENLTAQQKLAIAQSEYALAETNLHNTEIKSQIDGVVTSSSARIGGFLRTGSPVCAIAKSSSFYVKANFKETQISKLKNGFKAEVEIDAFKGKKFTGKVRNLYPATGAKFALIPTDSATGNFTKIVQKVPVIIDLDIPEEYKDKIAIGFSAYVKIRTDQ